MLSKMVREQSRVMANLDAFWIFGFMALAAPPLTPLTKRSIGQGKIAPH
jgi:hypothetical protein